MIHNLAIVVVVALLAGVTACSSSSPDAKQKSPAGVTASGGGDAARSTGAAPQPCRPPASDAEVPEATPVDAKGDLTVTSFDGTKIRAHWFPVPGLAAGATAPTVLMGPGWGMAGDTNVNETDANGALLSVFGVNIPTLHQQGYNVLTWDPRGFGKSDGTIEVDSKDFEGKDAQRLLSWVAAQPGVQLDAPGDPRVGMAGGSYGGGIQLVTAAIDCRVDAIVPQIAWHSLVTSLYKAETVKTGWAGLLYSVAAGRNIDAHLKSSYDQGFSTGVLSQDNRDWYQARGVSDLVPRIKVPTLFVQGTVDTLFTLDEAVANFDQVRKNRVPTAMVWYCGGHGFCLTNPGDRQRVTQATFGWLQRYLKRDTRAPAQPTFETIDQDGKRFTANSYPLRAQAPIDADGSGTLELRDLGGAGPATVPPGNPDLLAIVAKGITPAKAPNAVDVEVSWGDRSALVLGAPQVELTYHGTAGPEQRPSRVFAQLVDDTTGLVLGNQITPIQVVLDGTTHTTEVPLEMVAFSAKPGAHLTLQLVATTVAYSQPRLGGSVVFERVHVHLPTVAADS